MDDSVEEKKRRRRERKKQRYADEPEFREKVKAANRAHRAENKDAINAQWRDKYATDPEFRAVHSKRRRKNRLKNEYGISLDEYAAKLAEQRGLCVICLKPKEKLLCVDHNHKIRKPRSLLCGKCNRGLGLYDEDPTALRRAADYLEYWQWRHANPSSTGPPPLALAPANRFLAPTQQTIQYIEPEGEVMTTTDEPTEDNKASRMMRRAILHELHRPFDPDPPPPVDMLQAVSRAIVVKASQGDMTAAKEVLDRIDGKSLTMAPASADIPQQVLFTWKAPV